MSNQKSKNSESMNPVKNYSKLVIQIKGSNSQVINCIKNIESNVLKDPKNTKGLYIFTNNIETYAIFEFEKTVAFRKVSLESKINSLFNNVNTEEIIISDSNNANIKELFFKFMCEKWEVVESPKLLTTNELATAVKEENYNSIAFHYYQLIKDFVPDKKVQQEVQTTLELKKDYGSCPELQYIDVDFETTETTGELTHKQLAPPNQNNNLIVTINGTKAIFIDEKYYTIKAIEETIRWKKTFGVKKYYSDNYNRLKKRYDLLIKKPKLSEAEQQMVNDFVELENNKKLYSETNHYNVSQFTQTIDGKEIIIMIYKEKEDK